MADVIVSDDADRDLDKIFDYLASAAGRSIARKYRSNIEAIYFQIGDFPQLGVSRPSLGSDVRLMVVEPYCIFYRFDEPTDIVTILRVVDGRRRISARLFGKTDEHH